jgi:hypothetical protein
MRSRRVPALTAFGLLVALFGLACARPKKTGNARFIGSFKWQQEFGSQALAFSPGGKAEYRTIMPGEGSEASVAKARPATYSVVGDTAYMMVAWTDTTTQSDTLFLLLRGDSLIMLNNILGGNPVFMRER